MKAKELMQFDWVCIENDPTPRQVDFIRTGEVGLYWNKIVTPPYIKPIPITPEILEKNGFKGEMYAFLDISPNLYLEYYYHEHRLREWWTGIDEWNNHAEVKEIVDNETIKIIGDAIVDMSEAGDNAIMVIGKEREQQ